MTVLEVGDEVVATDVDRRTSVVGQARGWIGRSSVDQDEALAIEFDEAGRRGVHMIGVRTPLAVLWVVDGTVVRTRTLRPWVGFGSGGADTVIEAHPRVAKEVYVGDEVVLRE